MYGTNAPMGLVPRSTIGDATPVGVGSQYTIAYNYGTSIFTGDPVYLLNNGTIGVAAVGADQPLIVGSFQGVEYYDANNIFVRAPYWATGTPTYLNQNPVAIVIDNPWVLFDMQITGGAATIAQTDLNLNYNFANAGGSTISGQSGYSVDLTTATAAATANVKLIRLTPRPGNDFGVQYNNGLFLINTHVLKSAGTVGI